jgi:glycerophosphoryl diester phosphodiesterase
MATNNKYVLTIDGNEYRFLEEQELNNSKFNLEKLSYDMSDVVWGKALTRLWLVAIVLGLSACTDNSDQPAEVGVQTISNEMAAIRDYVPLYAVMAHRGSTYWAPEETESAWRWAREMGADYLESDLQCSKDGVIIANHDDNLKRTTNVEELFGAAIPATRMQFYESLGFSHEDALEQYQRDEASFRPYYMQSYYYAELLMLDAGKWFGESFAASRNGYFADGRMHYCTGQYVSALRDQIAYANGRMLQRKDDGERQLPYSIKPEYQGKTLHEIWQTIAAKGTYKDVYMDFLDYDFTKAYVDDPQDSGHRPGIYIEFKEPEVNPENMEQRVYDILDLEGWNIITKPATETAFYVNGKVNVGRTNGKVILQTFSNEALNRAYAIFKGRVPMCYLLWINVPPLPGDFELTTPEGFAQAIKYGLDHGAHIIGPSIAGEPNNYDELNAPWQAQLTRRHCMLNHPYSFDTQKQMEKYVDTAEGSIAADGCFTNRSDLTLQYMIDKGLRGRSDIPNPFHPGSTYDNSQAPRTVPDAVKTLQRLGYTR